MLKPICYVITQRNRGHPVLDRCLSSLDRWSWSWQIWPATVAPDAAQWQSRSVEILADRGKLRYRPGAQGCWISHFDLWQHCVDLAHSIIVLEHDVIAQSGWDPEIADRRELIKLYRSAPVKTNTITGQWSLGAHAYYLTPSNAQLLITHSRCHGAQALDKHLGDRVVDWQFWHRDLFLLDPHRGASTTRAYSANTPINTSRRS